MSGRHIGPRFPDNESYLSALVQDVLTAVDKPENFGRDLRQVAGSVLGEISNYTFEEIIRRVAARRNL